MNDQLLPDFDGPGSQLDAARPGPKKLRRKPTKKKVVRAPSLKVTKRVPKKRRVRKSISPILGEAPVLLLPDEAYKLIRGLMGMSKAQLTLVMEIVHKLTL